MTRTLCGLVCALMLAHVCARADEPAPTAWKLVWSDEFNGDAIDRSHWDFDTGNGFYNYDSKTWIAGWGNDELQYYTRDPDNAFVRAGMLHIVALKEARDGCGYTSARLKTRRKNGDALFRKQYGRFEFRAQLPTGQGVWPALWLLPHADKYGPWASSGEIDILEARGQEPSKILGTLHYGGRWPINTASERSTTLPRNGTISDFHVYALEWEPGALRWLVDDHEYARQSFWWSTSRTDGDKGRAPTSERDLNPWPAPFDQPFYIVMNLAVGGRFLGNPDKSTPFPAEMLIDYVRVFDRLSGYGPVPPRGPGKLPF